MGTAFLLGVVVAVLVLYVLMRRRRRPGDRASGEDTGQALLEFGRAFPEEPVRAVILTADGKDAFLRLADGKTGYLHTTGRHSLAHIVEPAFVEVEGPVDERTLALTFRNTGYKGGRFTFTRGEDAREVMLWLCGSVATTRQ